MSQIPPPGLRERKSARTQLAIERAAAELALAQGWEHTTVDQIADRAEVASRTVYVRYPSKESILLGGPEGGMSFREWVLGDDGDIVDRLARFVRSRVAAGEQDVEHRRLKLRAIWTDPALRRVLRGKLEMAEELIAVRVAHELGLPPDDAGPRVFAAAIGGLFMTMAGRAADHPDSFDPMTECANGLVFLRAGLDALKRRGSAA